MRHTPSAIRLLNARKLEQAKAQARDMIRKEVTDPTEQQVWLKQVPDDTFEVRVVPSAQTRFSKGSMGKLDSAFKDRVSTLEGNL